MKWIDFLVLLAWFNSCHEPIPDTSLRSQLPLMNESESAELIANFTVYLLGDNLIRVSSRGVETADNIVNNIDNRWVGLDFQGGYYESEDNGLISIHHVEFGGNAKIIGNISEKSLRWMKRNDNIMLTYSENWVNVYMIGKSLEEIGQFELEGSIRDASYIPHIGLITLDGILSYKATELKLHALDSDNKRILQEDVLSYFLLDDELIVLTDTSDVFSIKNIEDDMEVIHIAKLNIEDQKGIQILGMDDNYIVFCQWSSAPGLSIDPLVNLFVFNLHNGKIYRIHEFYGVYEFVFCEVQK